MDANSMYKNSNAIFISNSIKDYYLSNSDCFILLNTNQIYVYKPKLKSATTEVIAQKRKLRLSPNKLIQNGYVNCSHVLEFAFYQIHYTRKHKKDMFIF